MNESTHTPPAPPPTATPTASGGPAAVVTAQPGTALEIANMLAAGKIDTTQAAKLAKAAGFSALQVAQALHGSREAAPRAPIVQGPQTDLSEAQAAKIVEWTREDLNSGKITAAQANSIFNDLGTPAEQRIITKDTRSQEQILLDQHFPPAKESDFVIRYYTPGQEPPVMPKEMQQFDQSARTWLSGAEFPANLGNSLITNIEKVAQATKHMSPDELITYGEAEYAKLQQVYGDTLEDKLNAAGRMVHELDQKTPGLKNLLKSKGLGDNAMIASLLIQQAERWHARRKGR